MTQFEWCSFTVRFELNASRILHPKTHSIQFNWMLTENFNQIKLFNVLLFCSGVRISIDFSFTRFPVISDD